MSQKIKFENLTDDSKILRITVPLFTPVTKNPDDETDEQIMEQHEKFLALPETIKDKLACVKISQIIQQIGRVYGLELLQLADIARAIRSYYFGELTLEEFSFVLAKEMHIELDKARKIFQIIKERIIDDDSYEKAAQANLINLPLSEALKIHPEVGEQLITSQKINLRNFPYPVRPSIKNWLADYTFSLGHEKHESMERSQYLFQGANTKNLSAQEKQKLAYLLKSFDENSPITVNKNIKQVVFPASNAASIAPANTPAANSNLPKSLTDQFRPVSAPKVEQKNINSLQFSYRQTLPYEKNTAPTAAPREIPAGNRHTEHISQSQPQNLPKNVVDLKSITPL